MKKVALTVKAETHARLINADRLWVAVTTQVCRRISLQQIECHSMANMSRVGDESVAEAHRVCRGKPSIGTVICRATCTTAHALLQERRMLSKSAKAQHVNVKAADFNRDQTVVHVFRVH